jgi:hypothetical protein
MKKRRSHPRASSRPEAVERDRRIEDHAIGTLDPERKSVV